MSAGRQIGQPSREGSFFKPWMKVVIVTLIDQ